MLPKVIILQCDYGADWPTWVPGVHEPPDSGGTEYYPLDHVPLSEGLRGRLRSWQSTWEDLTWPPEEEERQIDAAQWASFVADGQALAAALQEEIGSDVEVRFGFA